MARIVIGIFILIFGVSLLFEQLGINRVLGFDFSTLVSMYWPLLLIAIGVTSFSKGKTNIGMILSFAGVLFLASTVLDIDAWATLWPIFIIALGIMILFKKPTPVAKINNQISNDTIDVTAIFLGSEEKVTSTSFRGGSVTALFGGATVDLREVFIAPQGGILTVTSIFGGVEIIVSERFRVVVKGEGAFGGWENHFTTLSDPNAPTLTITGTAIFGGVEVKN
ncbi:hypothetical protein COY32_04545 [candidate division WWE3 bacterium CG_4_10_14_0_2_um_filter_41_14]|uniref:LiaF transmembrane domain-containing protein n=1 Tax=candidate division WWE3 bacterium CG_4_10_14_0_2_um_filter_41_14 TaxID=1975072 RepID=A0A2M7THM8_UNCKA|nr:MAG: hypothetical protein COY32_04545 [candidate division WWE3 bacterium CG_4_10_14_0_2_um_filter_41_14]